MKFGETAEKNRGRIDLYKRGCFVLEAKQSRQKGGTKEVALVESGKDLFGEETQRGRRSTGAAAANWDTLMLNARRQAEDYARALPVEEGWPPFIITCDVGHALEVFADFSGQGKNYTQFPDRRGFRVYLDDLRENLTLGDKLTALFGSKLPGLFKVRVKPVDPGVILFTSGTEGDPKGVVLSHQNVLANVEQVRCHIELTEDDIVFNPLPTFHCFGLTVGAILPMIVGVKEILYPSPLHVSIIPKKIRESGATILLATDTFIGHYARQGDQGDLNSVRLAVCGAERVRDETRQLVRKKYNIEILEGYGVTEASPVVAANQIEANRPGTVGRLLPQMEHRLEPVEGIPNAGRLFVKGPNVMAGYLKPDQPGVLQTLPDGWHDTGDVVAIDKHGHIAIKGRLKRFAKIGGERVSLTVVENCASALWPDNMHAAVAIPDARKGEQIVLVTDAKEANRADLHGWAHNHGVPELAVPRKIIHVDEVPLLGTGKTNYVAVQKIADAETEPKAA